MATRHTTQFGTVPCQCPRRRVYKIKALGKKALDEAKEKVDELYHELHEEQPREDLAAEG